MSQPHQTMLDTKELIGILIREMGLHEGHFSLAVEFAFTAGNVGPSPDQTMPGAIIGISKIGIVESEIPTPNTVNASEVNPKKLARTKKATI